MLDVLWRVIPVALLLSAQLSARAEVYRWVDDKGQVHFGDQAREARTRVIQQRSTAPAPDDQQLRMQKTRRLLNAYQAERQQAREQKAKQEEQARERKRNCARARDNLRKYTDYGSIYRLADDGKREYLSDQERVALLQRSREAVAHWCGEP